MRPPPIRRWPWCWSVWGVDTLSMNAGAIPAVAAVLKSVTLEQARHIANKALEQISSAEAKAAARAELPILDELGL